MRRRFLIECAIITVVLYTVFQYTAEPIDPRAIKRDHSGWVAVPERLPPNQLYLVSGDKKYQPITPGER